jgi:hypothetical protein
VFVQIGISDGRNTAVTGEGLSEGDAIIVGGGPDAAAASQQRERPPGPRFL